MAGLVSRYRSIGRQNARRAELIALRAQRTLTQAERLEWELLDGRYWHREFMRERRARSRAHNRAHSVEAG
ncbi:hypothetical protein [Novosphingobium sp. UBA1939]|uniref:hypothetical protein n=1 Tax=Novosphingobium sp. UBA1939 TaxID=1946982 RepID=UPI0025FDA63D|nr:hypothetical protein [Novosphingobium sp. UBA1939]